MNKNNNKPDGVDVPQPVLMEVTLGGKVKHAAALTWWRTKLMSKAVHLGSTTCAVYSAGAAVYVSDVTTDALHTTFKALANHGSKVEKDIVTLRENKPILTFLPAIEDKPVPKATPKYVDMGTEYTL